MIKYKQTQRKKKSQTKKPLVTFDEANNVENKKETMELLYVSSKH